MTIQNEDTILAVKQLGTYQINLIILNATDESCRYTIEGDSAGVTISDAGLITFDYTLIEDLQTLIDTPRYKAGHIILKNNIELKALANFPGIQGFTGTFDGAGYEISELNYA